MPKKEVPKYDRIGFQLLGIHERFQDRTRQIGYDGWTGRGRASQLIPVASHMASLNHPAAGLETGFQCGTYSRVGNTIHSALVIPMAF